MACRPDQSLAKGDEVRVGADQERIGFLCGQICEYLIEARLNPLNSTGMGKSGTLTVAIVPVVLSRYFIIFFMAMVLSWLILQWRWERFRNVGSEL